MTAPGRSNIFTVVAIAIIAYAASDTVHEVVGHGSVALLYGFKVTVLSSVGLQSIESSRFLSAAGSLANVVFGVACLVLLRSRRNFGSGEYFLWLFGFVSSMNGTFYLVVSAFLNQGDWSRVIAGLQPDGLWRLMMGLVGLGAYIVTLYWAGVLMTNFVERQHVSRSDLFRLTAPAYVAGGVLLTIASIFNPFGRSLILMSGVGASFGLTWGLLLIPGIVERRTQTEARTQILTFSWQWLLAAAVVAAAFVAVLGPGVRLA